MDQADKLIAVGAQCVGGVLIYKHKELGRFKNGVFAINDDGLALLALDITDVEVKEKPKAKKAKVVEPVDAADDLTADLDKLLG